MKPSERYGLYRQIFRLGGARADLIVDAGGGNANLACLMAVVFGVPVCRGGTDRPPIN